MEADCSLTIEKSAKPKSKRRWYQYSLRTLMICVTLFAVACSWFAVKMQQAKKQREAVEKLLKSGGTVLYDYECDKSGHINSKFGNPPGPEWLRKILGNDLFTNVTGADLRNAGISDATLLYLTRLPHLTSLCLRYYPGTDLKRFTGFPHLKTLWIMGSRISDEGLDNMRMFSQLESLCLADAQITNSGLNNLQEMPQLQELYLQNNAITDDGLKYLQGLSQLQLLCLDKTAITDNGLKTLRKLSHLQTLCLNGTKITDAGLENLKDFGQLRTLGIHQTIITYAAIQDLQKALPNLKIER